MSALLLFPPELRQRPNVNARVTDVRAASSVESAMSLLSDTFGRGRSQFVGDDEAIDPTDCKELMASEHARPHSDICVGVSVGVHMHANLFVCLHLFVSIQERLVKSL